MWAIHNLYHNAMFYHKSIATLKDQVINIHYAQWRYKWVLKLWTLQVRDGFKTSLSLSNSWKYNVPWFHWNKSFYLWWVCQIKALLSWIQSLSLTLYREMCLAYHIHGPTQKWWRFSNAAGWICTWIPWKSAVDSNSKNGWDETSRAHPHFCAYLSVNAYTYVRGLIICA